MGGGTGTGQVVRDTIHNNLIRTGYVEATNFYTVGWQGSSNPSKRDNAKNLASIVQAVQHLNGQIKDDDLIIIPAQLVPSSQASKAQAPYAIYLFEPSPF